MHRVEATMNQNNTVSGNKSVVSRTKSHGTRGKSYTLALYDNTTPEASLVALAATDVSGAKTKDLGSNCS